MMIAESFKVTIHMVASLDGFIARKDQSISWFETVDHYDSGVELTAQDIGQFLRTIDCYVMGARTYEHALELSRSYGWAYGDKPTIVVTHRQLPVELPQVELYSGDLTQLIKEHLKTKYRNVWVAGGAILAKELLLLGLVDEISLSIMPIILGDGTLFLDHIGVEQSLHLAGVTAYKSGMVELRYTIVK